jgi:hypothetical protein
MITGGPDVKRGDPHRRKFERRPGIRGARFARYQFSDAVSAPGRDRLLKMITDT